MFKVIVDSSILIDHLRGLSEEFTKLEDLRLKGEIEILIPHSVIVELYAGHKTKDKGYRQSLDLLLNDYEVVGLNTNSAKKAGELIRNYPQIPDPFDLL